jgi:hypothetical protein
MLFDGRTRATAISCRFFPGADHMPDPAVTAKTVSRTRWLKRPWFRVSTMVLLAGVAAFALSDSVRFVVCSTVVASIYGVTGSKDVDEAAALRQAVTSKSTSIHRFVRNSITRPDRPPIYVDPRSRAILTQPPLITVYA